MPDQADSHIGPADFDIIIGLTGHKAAGKDTFADYLAGRGFVVRRCSDDIRLEASRRGDANPTVDTLIAIGNWGRSASGDFAYWPKQVLRTLKSMGHRRVIVNGLRHPGEVEGLVSLMGASFVMVGVTAPTAMRATRLLKRARPGDPVDYEKFLKLDDDDRGIGQPRDGQQVDRTMALVPWENMYNNRGTLEEYHAWIEAFLKRALGS
jgi:dephospho-CoA kinase